MRAQRREIAQQRVGDDQEAETLVGVLFAVVPRLLQHVGQHRGECGIGVVGVAARQPVGEVVLLAGLVLVDDLAQIECAVGQRRRGHLVQAPPLPVRQDEEHRQAGYQRADQGIDQPRQDQVETVADLVEAAQHQRGDGGSGDDVMLLAIGEEDDAGHHGNQRLEQRVREQADQRPAHHQADYRTDDALAQEAARGTEVGPTHEQRGQQDPVALGRVNQMQHAIAHQQRGRQAKGMTKGRRSRRQVETNALPGVAKAARRAVEETGVLLIDHRIRVVGAGELVLQCRQVTAQCLQRAQQRGPFRIALRPQVDDRRPQILQRLLALAVLEGLAQQQCLGQPLARPALLVEQPLAAKQHVVMEEGLGQCRIGVMGGADPLVDVLGDEIEPQVAVELAAATLALEPAEDHLLGLIERGHHAAVLARQRNATAFDIDPAQRLEQCRLDDQIFAQLPVELRHALLDRLAREQRTPDDRNRPVPGRTADQQ